MKVIKYEFLPHSQHFTQPGTEMLDFEMLKNPRGTDLKIISGPGAGGVSDVWNSGLPQTS